jgi:hypothetical protein
VSYPSEVTTVLVVTLAIIVADLVLRTILRRERPARKEPSQGSPLFRGLRLAVNVGGVVTLFLVASTAMSRLMTNEATLTGDRLIWHVSMAPAFAVAAVVVAMFWAYRNRFAASDRRRGWALPLRKIFFWLSMLIAIPTFVTIIVAMYPVTDTAGQAELIELHRTCGPLLAGTGLLFAYFALMTWIEGSKD